MKLKMQNKKTGFTLIELIVVMAVFLFVIGAALGIFLSIVQHQKSVLAETQLFNQISYAEEYMSRALRMARAEDPGQNCLIDANNTDHPGYIYLLTRPDPSSGFFQGIKFLNQSDEDSFGRPMCEEFYVAPASSNDNRLVLWATRGSDAPIMLTPTALQINSVKFSINRSNGNPQSLGCNDTNQCGASKLDPVQPRVTILLNVKVAGDSQEPERIIQTTISQRNLNVK